VRAGWLVSSGVAVLVLSGQARAECILPEPAPVVPDGATASDSEMHAARDSIQKFVNSLQDYQVCLEAEVKSAPPDTRLELKLAWRTLGNAAIDQAQALAADYAQQLAIYKGRTGAAPPHK